MLQASKTCLVVSTLITALAFPAEAQSDPGDNPPAAVSVAASVHVSVYDDAGVPTRVLDQAEHEAAKIFANAGVEVAWNNCSTSRNHLDPDALIPAAKQRLPGSGFENSAYLQLAKWAAAPAPTTPSLENRGCAHLEWPAHLAVRILPKTRRSAGGEVFGMAFLSAEGAGCYSDVFYDRVTELQIAWNFGLSEILGSVMAHELGHLLLGSASHAAMGIMRARWQAEELHRAARGNLLFTTEQSDQMRAKLKARLPWALTAQSSY
jgi:hypothetical protein